MWGGNAFSAWPSVACAPVAADEVAIEAPPVYGKSETHLVNTLTGSQISFDGEKLVYSYTNLLAMVRWAGFWPCLRLPQDKLSQPPITNEHAVIWALDLTLEVDPAVYYLAGDEYTSMARPLLDLGGTSLSTESARQTLDQLVANVRMQRSHVYAVSR